MLLDVLLVVLLVVLLDVFLYVDLGVGCLLTLFPTFWALAQRAKESSRKRVRIFLVMIVGWLSVFGLLR